VIEDCKLINLPKFVDPRGNLSFIEGGEHIPFDIKRVYYLYGLAEGTTRAGHGHRNLKQFMIALTGSFIVEIYDGERVKVFKLDRPDVGLFIPPMMWRDLHSFSDGAVCMVLASDVYDEADYFRDRVQFINAVKTQANISEGSFSKSSEFKSEI
jgi:dTDP-4-dehydrorhamnose 3,5-epimerase-like enzyme